MTTSQNATTALEFEQLDDYSVNYEIPLKTMADAKYDALGTKSAKIRAMAADGMSRTAIAKSLNIRYQHVRNVLMQELKSA